MGDTLFFSDPKIGAQALQTKSLYLYFWGQREYYLKLGLPHQICDSWFLSTRVQRKEDQCALMWPAKGF